MKRTELKRTKPMKRGPGPKRTSGPSRGGELKRTPLRARSAKRAKLMRTERVPLIESLRAQGVGCLVCPALIEAGIAIQCSGAIEGIHERRKRSAGGSLINPANLIPACNRGNGFVEDECGMIRRLTGDRLIVREGDPEWESLGARNDGIE